VVPVSQYERRTGGMVMRLVGGAVLLLGIGLLLAGPSGAEPSAPASVPASTAPVSTTGSDSPSTSTAPSPTVIDDPGLRPSGTPSLGIGGAGPSSSQPEPSYSIGDAISTSRVEPSYSIGPALAITRASAPRRSHPTTTSAVHRVVKHPAAPAGVAVADRTCRTIPFVPASDVCAQPAVLTTDRSPDDVVARTGPPVISLVLGGLLLSATGVLLYLAARRVHVLREGTRYWATGR
jgi:hypothetical protein